MNGAVLKHGNLKNISTGDFKKGRINTCSSDPSFDKYNIQNRLIYFEYDFFLVTCSNNASELFYPYYCKIAIHVK